VIVAPSGLPIGLETEAIGIVHASVEGHHGFGIVEFRPGLLQLTIVHLQGGVERGIELDCFEKTRVQLGLLVDGIVALFECLGAQWLVR